MRKRGVMRTVLASIILMMLACNGCTSREREKLKEEYPEEKAKELAEEYLEEKYDEEFKVEKIKEFHYTYTYIDATGLSAFKGYYMEVQNFHVFMDFDEEGEYSFSDDKQLDEIRKAYTKKLKDNYDGKGFIYWNVEEVPSIEEDDTGILCDFNYDAFHDYFDGDLESFLDKTGFCSDLDIFLDTLDEKEEEKILTNIIEEFEDADIYELEKGVYDDCLEVMTEPEMLSDYKGMEYCKVRVCHGEIEKFPWKEVENGIYLKSAGDIEIRKDAQAALNEWKNYVSARYYDMSKAYVLCGDEKYVFIPEEDLNKTFLLVNSEKMQEVEVYEYFQSYDNIDGCVHGSWKPELEEVTGTTSTMCYEVDGCAIIK